MLLTCRRITPLYRSNLDNDDVSERLLNGMCEAFPEQVAVKKDKAWYASGCRVRGKVLESVVDAGLVRYGHLCVFVYVYT